jgi:hypothetical protein
MNRPTDVEIAAEIIVATSIKDAAMDRDEICYQTGVALALGWVLGLAESRHPAMIGYEQGERRLKHGNVVQD